MIASCAIVIALNVSCFAGAKWKRRLVSSNVVGNGTSAPYKIHSTAGEDSEDLQEPAGRGSPVVVVFAEMIPTVAISMGRQ